MDLLELSLLKSVAGIAHPIETNLITLDADNVVKRKLDYTPSGQGLSQSPEKVPEGFIFACDQLKYSSKCHFSAASGDELVNAFRLMLGRHDAHYVMLLTKQCLSTSETQQISGMLQIFQNFKKLLNESQTDELTGLTNRKPLDSTLAKVNDNITPQIMHSENDRRESVVAPT